MVSFAPDSELDRAERDLVLARSSVSLLRDEVVRQGARLDRISRVLCDGLGEDPAAHWLAADIDASRMGQVAALIEELNL